MSDKCVVIFRERNDACVYGIPLDQYPTGKVPEVGDIIALRAQRTLRSVIVGGEKQDLTTTYIDGLVEVLDVWVGTGNLLHPNGGCSFYSFNDELDGYGIRISFEDAPLPQGITPIDAYVIFGL